MRRRLMHAYETAVIWTEGKEGRLRSREHPELAVAAPPEFGGPQGVWSGEELFVGSVAGCLMSTFLYFVELARLELASYVSASKGLMEKTQQGLRFSGIEVEISAAFADERSLRKALSMKLESKLERYCPVSNAVGCPVRLSLKLSGKDGGQDA